MGSDTSSRPGVRVGPTSEFSLFFHVKPGHGEALHQALRDLQDAPGYRPGDYEMPIASIHEARFVPFDDDTRLLFATSFDGPWDAYMEDFAVEAAQALRLDLPARRGLRGPPDVAGGQGLHPQRPADRRWLRPQLRRHGEGDPQGRTVNEAFQEVLDDPEAAEALQHPALRPLLDVAAD